jgi:hypothetical protein
MPYDAAMEPVMLVRIENILSGQCEVLDPISHGALTKATNIVQSSAPRLRLILALARNRRQTATVDALPIPIKTPINSGTRDSKSSGFVEGIFLI